MWRDNLLTKNVHINLFRPKTKLSYFLSPKVVWQRQTLIGERPLSVILMHSWQILGPCHTKSPLRDPSECPKRTLSNCPEQNIPWIPGKFMILGRKGNVHFYRPKVSGFWSPHASPQTRASTFLNHVLFVALKRCPIATTIAGSIGFLPFCVLNNFFT